MSGGRASRDLPVEFRLATCRHLPQLTPDDEVLRLALEARGAAVAAAPWDAIDPDDGAAPLVCLRSTWDYHRRWPEFKRWVECLAAHPGRLWNPASTVLWNADKVYLRELAEAGVAIPHTRWYPPGERPDWAAGRAVLKPRVSATAHGTYVVEPGCRLSEAEWAPLESSGSLMQDYVPEIAAGEASLVFIDGEFSHAVLKRPAAGEFRVQRDFGGRIEELTPEPTLRQFTERVLAAVSCPWVYARVDVVETRAGPLLMELELIEPELFFARAPSAAGRLAEALIRSAGRA